MKYINEKEIYFLSKLFRKMMIFLIHSSNIIIRAKTAKHGYGLDILINDPHWSVREQVARYRYGLDILINDPSWIVRYKVAKHGYGLDILINDPSPNVRKIAKEKKQDEIYY